MSVCLCSQLSCDCQMTVTCPRASAIGATALWNPRDASKLRRNWEPSVFGPLQLLELDCRFFRWAAWTAYQLSPVHRHIERGDEKSEPRSRLLRYIWYDSAFSALTLLVGLQEGHPACKKTEWWGAGMVICLERGADLHTAQLMPLPLTVSCFSKILIGFTFL